MSKVPPEFETLFWKCLDELPVRDSEVIKNYWAGWEVMPALFSEKLPLSTNLFRGNAASVGPISSRKPVLAEFKFHYVLANYAPENIKKAVIKHELAHCYLMGTHEHYKTEVALEKWRKGSTHISQLLGERIQPGRAPYFDKDVNEQQARLKNEGWGSDEKSIDLWYESFGRRA